MSNRLFKDIFAIIIFSAIIGFSVNFFHDDGFAFYPKSYFQKRKIVYLSVDETLVKFNSPYSVFIDSRDPFDFLFSHIKGAVNIPSDPESESIKKINKYKHYFDLSHEIIVYCISANCDSSEVLAQRIISTGYKGHVYIIRDGFTGWRSRRLPSQSAEQDK